MQTAKCPHWKITQSTIWRLRFNRTTWVVIFDDEDEQIGRVVAYLPPNDMSDNIEMMGERWVVEYDVFGVQELMTSSELLVSLDSEASQDAWDAVEEQDQSEEEEEKEDVNQEEKPPRSLPDVPQAHPLIGKRIGNEEDEDRGVMVMWYFAKVGGKKARRFFVK